MSSTRKSTPSSVKCPKDKIVNPATGRCVKASGKIGREVQKTIANAQYSPKTAKTVVAAAKNKNKKPSTDAFRKVLATCIKNNEPVSIRGFVPFVNIVKFGTFNIGYSDGFVKQLADSKWKHIFSFNLVKQKNVWNIITSHSYYSDDGSGGGGLVYFEDVMKSHILGKPNAEQRSSLVLIYDTLRIAKIMNVSIAPLSVYNVIGQSVPEPTVYTGQESIDFKVTNTQTKETHGYKAKTHVINGKLADLIDAGKYTSTLLVKEALRGKWKASDVIGIESQMGYRNNGKFFWNGKRIIEMNDSIDDYGSVPDAFPITGKADGFDAHTWLEEVDHNDFVPVNFGVKIGREMNAYSEKKDFDYFVFTINDVNWAVCGRGQLVGGVGVMTAAYETDLVKYIMTKYNIPHRQILAF